MMSIALERYLPLLDPDEFHEMDFYRGLERIGYRQVLLGGTGAADLAGVARAIKQSTALQVILVPTGPDSVTSEVDAAVMPDVMNTHSHFARPFGSGSVATAMNIARCGIEPIPVAYFIMGESTAKWYFDAFSLKSRKLILSYAQYAKMVGYRTLALDYEDPNTPVDERLVSALAAIDGLDLVVSSEFTPKSAAAALDLGVSTVITPSDVFEESTEPLALAETYYHQLLDPISLSQRSGSMPLAHPTGQFPAVA